MRAIVTGAAGFIGTRVVEMLLAEGAEVTGIDSLSGDLYSSEVKEKRLLRLSESDAFRPIIGDLAGLELEPLMGQCDVVIHEAAMPGLTLSWERFSTYSHSNLIATEHLLRAVSAYPNVHLVHASTSSVYGLNALGNEQDPLNPISPYGVTKLAAEHLIHAYTKNFGLSATVLRYFSVYGPSQRPDMAYERFCESLVRREPIPITGDGHQSRTNTHIDDVARATISAARMRLPGETMNICGDQEMELLDVVDIFAEEIGVTPEFIFHDPRPGDQYRTRGDASKARELLDWKPIFPLEGGLRAQARSVVERLAD